MNEPHPHIAQNFDNQLSAIADLTWLPWIGANYPTLPSSDRLLIVGESHYTDKKDAAEARRVIDDHHKNRPDYTRNVCFEIGMGKGNWKNRTFDEIHRTLSGGAVLNREVFWQDIAFYNHVQRMLWFERPGGPERPSPVDFTNGWQVFAQVVEAIRPSHCLFVGVAASNYFNKVVAPMAVPFTKMRWTERVGRTWGRIGSITIGSHTTQIHAIQHCGRYFSPDRWNAYLRRHAPEIIALTSGPRYSASS